MQRAAFIVLSIAFLCCVARAQEAAKKKGLFFSDEIKIEASYDKFEDKTTVTLMPLSVKSGFLDEFGLYAGFTYPGQQLSEPKTITLGFAYSVLADSPNPQFKEKHDLILLINGERLLLGTTIYDSATSPTLLGSAQLETMKLHLSPQLFSRIVTAKSVEARLGTIDFKLTDHHLLGLSKLLARTW
jgi:hypothetical protein